MYRVIALLVLSFTVSITAHAEARKSEVRELERQIIQQKWPACLDPRNFYDQVYCASKTYGVADDVLNEQYKKTTATLTKEQVQALKKVQRAWIKKRDDKCASVTEDGIILNLDCSTSATVESIYYLKKIEQNPGDFSALLEEYQQGN